MSSARPPKAQPGAGPCHPALGLRLRPSIPRCSASGVPRASPSSPRQRGSRRLVGRGQGERLQGGNHIPESTEGGWGILGCPPTPFKLPLLSVGLGCTRGYCVTVGSCTHGRFWWRMTRFGCLGTGLLPEAKLAIASSALHGVFWGFTAFQRLCHAGNHSTGAGLSERARCSDSSITAAPRQDVPRAQPCLSCKAPWLPRCRGFSPRRRIGTPGMLHFGQRDPKTHPWRSPLLPWLAADTGAERCSLFSTGAETFGAKKNARSYKKAGEQRDIHGELQSAAS